MEKDWKDLLQDKKGRKTLEIFKIEMEGGILVMTARRDPIKEANPDEFFYFGGLTPHEVAKLLVGGWSARASYEVLPRRVPRLVFYQDNRRRSFILARVAGRLQGRFFRVKPRAYPMREKKLYFIGPAFSR